MRRRSFDEYSDAVYKVLVFRRLLMRADIEVLLRVAVAGKPSSSAAQTVNQTELLSHAPLNGRMKTFP